MQCQQTHNNHYIFQEEGRLLLMDIIILDLIIMHSQTALGDQTGLTKEPRFAGLLPAGQKIAGSCEIQKFNDSNKCQLRIFLITDQAVYNIQRNQNFIKSMMSKLVSFQKKFTVRRRIPFEQIEAITMSNQDGNDEFVLHVLNDYDYRFRMHDYNTKVSLLKCLCLQYQRRTKKKIAFYFKNDLTLIQYCTFKSDIKAKKNKKPMENPVYLNMQDLIDYELPGVQFKAVRWPTHKKVSINMFKSSSVEKLKPGRQYFAIQAQPIHFASIQEKCQLRHPFLFLPAYCFQTTENLYMLWQLSIGGRLDKIMKKGVVLKKDLCIFYVSQLILVLEYLHENNWVYRNLNLEDVYIKENGYIWIDGLVSNMRMKKSKNQLFYDICGMHSNMPPEMILMEGHSQGADVWALAICTYIMIQGHHPFSTGNIKASFHRILSCKLEQTEALPEFVFRVLVNDPKERITLGEIKKDPWFGKLDWEKVKEEQMVAPYIPQLDEVNSWEGKMPSILYLQKEN